MSSESITIKTNTTNSNNRKQNQTREYQGHRLKCKRRRPSAELGSHGRQEGTPRGEPRNTRPSQTLSHLPRPDKRVCGGNGVSRDPRPRRGVLRTYGGGGCGVRVRGRRKSRGAPGTPYRGRTEQQQVPGDLRDSRAQRTGQDNTGNQRGAGALRLPRARPGAVPRGTDTSRL